MACYAFESNLVLIELVLARRRGCKVWIVADKGFASSGRCKNHEGSLAQLASEGCLGRTAKGLPRAEFGGLRHSKFVMCDFGGGFLAMLAMQAVLATLAMLAVLIGPMRAVSVVLAMLSILQPSPYRPLPPYAQIPPKEATQSMPK